MKTRIIKCLAIVVTLGTLAYMAVSTGQTRNANAADTSTSTPTEQPAEQPSGGGGGGGCCG